MNRIFMLITSILILAVFTFTSCYHPFNYLPQKAAVNVIEIGKGTPVFVYLDSDYKTITESIGINDPDPGKTALVVLDNPMAEGVMVLAETTTVGTTVSIINSNDQSAIYMFYDESKNFPSSLVITTHGERTNAFLSSYNTQKEQYSIVFEEDKGEDNMILNNVIMTQGILNAYTDDLTLSEAQNTRVRNIYTSLGVFASLNYALAGDGYNSTVFLAWGAREWTILLLSVAFVAFVVAAIFLPPLTIAIVGAAVAITPASTSIAYVIGAVAIIAVAIINRPETSGGSGGEGGGTPPTPKRMYATIMHDGTVIESGPVYDNFIGSNSVYLIKNVVGTSIEFDIEFMGRESIIEDIQYFFYDTKDKIALPRNNAILAFEIEGKDTEYGSKGNYLSHDLGNKIKLRVVRKDNGYVGDGIIWFALSFRHQETQVNGTDIELIDLSTLDEKQSEKLSQVYFIRVTALDPENP